MTGGRAAHGHGRCFLDLNKPASSRTIGSHRVSHSGRQFLNRSRVFHVRRQLDPQPVFQRKDNVSDRELIYAEFSKIRLQCQVLPFFADDAHYHVEYESLRELFDHYPAPQPYIGSVSIKRYQ